jgi:hypothetical protein
VKDRIVAGASVSSLITIPWLIMGFLGYNILQIPIIPFELFERFVTLIPGSIITPILEAMIQTLVLFNVKSTSTAGKSFQMFLALILGFICLTLLGLLYALTLDRLRLSWILRGAIAGLSLTLIFIPIIDPIEQFRYNGLSNVTWLLSMNFLWGLSVAWGVSNIVSTLNQNTYKTRQEVLTKIGIASIAMSIFSLGLNWLVDRKKAGASSQDYSENNFTELLTPMPAPTPSRFMSTPGMRPEVTPIDDFYRVDINLLPPGQVDYASEIDNFTKLLLAQGGETDIPPESYALLVDGLVSNPQVFDMNAIKSFTQIEQYATLSCISNPIGGDLIDTTFFQGIRLKDILSEVGIMPEASKIKFTCVDGYTESLPIDIATDPATLLCYSMGNNPLTESHGSPIRLYTPGRFGMKSPKWIIKIEAIEENFLGYWEQQGWSDEAITQTISIIDTIVPNSQGTAEIGGIAFAGVRGIRSVQVKINENEWIETNIKEPLSPFTWVLWQVEAEVPPGESIVTVRAIDGDGNVQTIETSPPHPSGATGYHSRTLIFDT